MPARSVLSRRIRQLPSSLRFFGIPRCPGAFCFRSNGTESDRHIFAGFVQTEASLLNLGYDLRHVGDAPRDDNVVRLRQPGPDFLQEVPIALAQEIVQELLLLMGRRRVAQQFQQRLRIHTL